MQEYLSIGEISRLFHLNKQTLQYYDREEIFSPKYRNPSNNYRMYRFDQVYRLALICYLRKIGFSIAQIKNYLNLADSQSAIRELKNQSQQLKQQYQQVLSMDHVLQRKLNFVEQKLQTLKPGQEEIRTYPQRKYLPLGEEGMLYYNEVFYFYPTIAFVQRDPDTGEHTRSFGAYLEPEDVVPVNFIDKIGTIPSQRFLCASYVGPYEEVIRFSAALRQQHPELHLANHSFHFNIIDQFIASDSKKYLTEVQIPILSDADVPE